MKNIALILSALLIGGVLFLSCKKESEAPPVIPKLVAEDVVVTEGNIDGKKAIITVDLSEATTVDVSLNWSTEDATAKAGEDFVAVTDQPLIFLAGEVSKVIEISILSDTYLELDGAFVVKFSNLQNTTMLIPQVKVTIEDDDNYVPLQDADGYITPDNYPGMSLIWSDEFDDATLNTTSWNYEIGGGGWGNNELEIYTDLPANSNLQNGFLTITALKNPYNGNYTSARLTTKGKEEFTYGRIDIRAKMPIGQGIWPALWMLGGNISSVGWPACGEIDIMEYLGHESDKVHGTIHYNDGGHKYIGGSYKVNQSENYHDKFHVFTILWQENSIEWFVDYKRYYTVTPSTIKYDAFRLPQFFIFNVAVGGNWPGSPNASTVFPQSMIVDYVRVFQ
ncbi:MAG: family 16 glycosylhydrolase [Bacteroidales bacterium]|nr:family 16 glycosylhydrolase [Bacteroidales bacterium]